MLVEHQLNQIVGDRYELIDVLGKGSVGITYSAIALATQEKVAIKAISLRQLKDWKQIELFEREANTLMQLNHSAIPQYLDYFQIVSDRQKLFYIVQQLAPGKSLGELVESGWRGTEAQIKDIATQILDILIYLHSLKPPIVHRDLKPHNLILSDEGKVYLVDFGAVQNTYYNTLMRGSTVVGTYGYMAPEQFQGRSQPPTDLYGLGATILYLLTHRSPAELPHDNLAVNFRSHVKISEELAVWLEKMLQPDLEQRFASAKVAKDALKNPYLSLTNTRNKRKLTFNFIVTSATAIAIVAGIFAFNAKKWAILGYLGIQPNFYELTENPKMMKNYLQRGGDPNAENEVYGNLLDQVIWKNNLEITKLLITYGANVNAKNEYLTTPLHNAMGKDNLEIAKLLITHGADVNAKNEYLTTPLHNAMDKDNLEIAKLLITHGADVSPKDKFSRTPLHETINNNHETISKDNLAIAELLITHGADVNVQDENSITPLHEAIYKNNSEIAKLLITHGADVNAQNYALETPLRIAVDENNYEMVKLLKKSGAKP
jgi:serine/threonine protein kinase